MTPDIAPLRLGAARVDITPDWPLPLSGFAARTGLSDGVATPLHLRAAVLERGPDRALVLTADLLNWGPQQMPGLRRQLAERVGVEPHAILFSASHSHSGPATSTWLAPSLGVADPRFLDRLAEQAAAAAAAAAADLEEVSVATGVGEYGLGMNRRSVVDGHVTHGVDPAAPRDPEVTVIAFRRPVGDLKAVLTHYTCHPVMSGEQKLCGEFTGAAMDFIEKDTGGTALFLQGCCGDINPCDAAAGVFVRGLDHVLPHGRELADIVLSVLDGQLASLAPAPLRARWAEAELPFQSTPTPAELAEARSMDGVMGEWGRAFTEHPERIRPSSTLVAQRIDLAAGQSLLAFNGEVTVPYGLAIKKATRSRALPVAYANGMVGYLPTADQIRAGGYEADTSTRYYLLPGRYSPDIEDIITRTAMGLIPDLVG